MPSFGRENECGGNEYIEMDVCEEGNGVENRLQVSYVLHGGSTIGSEKSAQSSRRASRKGGRKEDEYERLQNLPLGINKSVISVKRRLRAFSTVWARIQKLIEDIVEEQNQDFYAKLQQWVCNRQYGDAQLDLCQSARTAHFLNTDAAWTFQWPRTRTALRKQLHTAMLIVGGLDPSDHQRTFDGLIEHLRAHKCHVARLTSVDFSPKAGVGRPLLDLFRQLIGCIPETADMEILLAWHRDPGNNGLPVVIVVEDAESCDSNILGEFIMLLSDWIGDIPMVLVMGIATTCEAVSKRLPAHAVVQLCLWRFTLKSPPELLELVIRAITIDSFCAFELSHGVVDFLYGFFQGHDHTVTAIFKAFKIASMEHFWKGPLSFLCGNALEANSKSELEEECSSLPEDLLNQAATLPSVARLLNEGRADLPLSVHMAESLWQLRGHKKMWAMAFLCLQSVGRYAGIGFAELLCQALIGSYILPSADEEILIEGSKKKKKDRKSLPLEQLMCKFSFATVDGCLVTALMESCSLSPAHLLGPYFGLSRDIPGSALKSVLEEWRKVTVHEKELNEDICHLLADFNAGAKEDSCSPEAKCIKAVTKQDYTMEVMDRSKLRRIGRQQMLLSNSMGVKAVYNRAKDLLQRILRQFLIPAESLPFNEIFCFNDVNLLRQALVGQTRKRVHLDLLQSRDVLNCTCCPTDGMPSSSLPDTALAYALSQDNSHLIEVPNWYQSFTAICHPKDVPISEEEPKVLKGRRQKKKDLRNMKPVDTVTIRARFTRAASELHVVGLLQLPKRGQSDTVRRINIQE